MMTIVAKIEIMEERMAVARLTGRNDIADYYEKEIKKIEKEEREKVVRA